MRTVIDNRDFLAEDIRPDALLAEYKALVERDVAAMAPQAGATMPLCPGCGADSATPAFSRYGFDYAECSACGTLWIVRRPPSAAIRAFYRTSDAERFWQTRLAEATADARASHIVAPRIDWMIDSIQEHRPDSAVVADVGTQLDVFASRLATLDRFQRRLIVDPVATVTASGVEVLDQPFESVGFDGVLDVASLYDVLDRTADPAELLTAVFRALKPGGLLFATGILASGFDIQTLWEKAETVFPPDRLNVFSVTGLQALLARHDFEILELSTPGAFDLKAVARAAEADPTLTLPRFVRTLLRHRDTAERQQFQAFLQSTLLSSFGRVLARKKP